MQANRTAEVIRWRGFAAPNGLRRALKLTFAAVVLVALGFATSSLVRLWRVHAFEASSSGDALASAMFDASIESIASSRRAPSQATDEPAAALSASASASTAVSAVAARPGAMEFCGFGFFSPDDAGREAFEKRTRGLFEKSKLRWHAALLASTDEDARAVGRLLAVQDAVDRVPRAALEACGDEDGACTARETRTFQAAAAVASSDAVQALVRQAIETGGPLAYGLAVDLCGVAGDATARPGACQLINLGQWARVDPDNMAPWLAIAAAASARKDAATRDEAFYRASLAKRHSEPGMAMLGAADASLASGFTDLERLLASVDMVGIAATTYRSWSPYLSYCSVGSVADRNRYEVCDRLTTTILKTGPSMMDEAVALRVAKNLRWPADLLARLNSEHRVVFDEMSRAWTGDDKMSCAALNRVYKYGARSSRIGEVASGRLAVAESGRTMATAVAELALADEARRVAAAASAAAASTAPAAAPPESTSSAPPSSAASTPYSATPPPAR